MKNNINKLSIKEKAFIKRKFREHVEVLAKIQKGQSGYKFINYAVYLIYEDMVDKYIINQLEDYNMNISNELIIGNKQDFDKAIDKFNIGKRIDNSNRSNGIDTIDKNSLVTNFDRILVSFNDDLIAFLKNRKPKKL